MTNHNNYVRGDEFIINPCDQQLIRVPRGQGTHKFDGEKIIEKTPGSAIAIMMTMLFCLMMFILICIGHAIM